MLDPDWTPERGYSHAARLLQLADEAERAEVAACKALQRVDERVHLRTTSNSGEESRMIDVVVVRDPDFSNAISVFGEDDAVIVDIDAGRTDLSSPEEWNEWQESLRMEAARCHWRDAHKLVAATVAGYAESLGHEIPSWTRQ